MLLLFTYPDYYPSGGATDLTAIVESVDQACRFIVEHIPEIRTSRSDRWSTDNAHVFNTETGEITELAITVETDQNNCMVVKSCTVTEGVTHKSKHFRPLGVD